ncbi:MAG: hypothetical protein HKO56_07270, partial [Bacteroidia bacterium]|nr:hypothetical protein [Bacteroidia bacterium]
NDGIPDALEAFGMTTPADYNKTLGWNVGIDSDSDGLLDLFDNAPAVQYTAASTSNIANPNTDGDGRANVYDLDSDNDGIVDAIEHNNGSLPVNMNSNGQYPPTYALLHDTYQDGLIDGVDPKSGADDNFLLHNDSDGNPDYLDIDSDNDGIVDNTEGQTTLGFLLPTGNDTDNDGIDNAYDINAGGAPITPLNTDNNDTPDYLDLDADNDFVLDTVEGHDPNMDGIPNTTATGSDTDGDGLDNAFDTVNGFTASGNSSGNNAALQDTDGDGDRDWRDRDDDGDGYLTIDETPDIDPVNGTPDYLEVSPQACPPGQTSTGPPTNGNADAWSIMAGDVDNPGNSLGVPDGVGAKVKDNDGWLMVDLTDTIPQGSTITLVIAGDNTSEDAKIFASLDGITHSDTVIYTFTVKDPTYETFIYNVNQATGVRYISVFAYTKHTWLDAVSYSVPTCSPDNDNDGIWNGLDVDDDNDGIPDSLEAFAAGNINPDNDADSDGIPDFQDAGFAGCGGLNSWGICSNFDTDGDGVADHLDLDSDDDGIADAYEANGGVLPTNMTPEAAYPASHVILNDPNGNGWARDVDPGDGGTQLPYTNTDTDVFPDWMDLDSDDDGIVDNIEAQPTIGYVFRNLDDVDNDGMDDAYDYDLFGKLVPIVDTDSDGIPDYIDLDSDDDLVPDSIEGHDVNADGIADLSFALPDLDGDGLRDSYDPDYIVCLSTYNGQASNGGCAAIQDTDGDLIRDWRDTDDDNDGTPTKKEDQDALCTGGPPDGNYANDFCEFGTPHPDYLFPILIKANDDYELVVLGDSVNSKILLNDVFVFSVTPTITNAPSNGTSTLLNSDSIKYVPNPGFYGWDTTQYQICGTLPAAELLLNGSAEAAPFVGSGWIDLTTGSTYQQNFVAPGPITGASYFDANSIDVNAELYQDINLSIFADKIDLGTKQFVLDAFVGTVNTAQWDRCRIIVEWRNAATLLIGSYDSGYILGLGIWQNHNALLTAPVGARSVRIRLIGNMISPPTNDTRFEDVSFQTLPELQCDTANLLVRVITKPMAVNDTAYVAMEDTSAINVLPNDTDLDNNIQPNTVNILGLPGPFFGSVTSIHPVTGVISYLPNPGFFGVDSLQYSICDSTALCDTAWVIINVIQPPIAVDDTIILPEDSLYVVSIFLNDTNGTGTIQDSLLVITMQPSDGIASA